MNLVLSGPIDPSLLDSVVALAKPRKVIELHAQAARLVDVVDAVSVRAEVLALCDTARIDHAYIKEDRRFADFKLLAIDMDSTLITIECIDEIADFVGKKLEVAAITEATMRGEIPDFAESLRRRVALLAGVSETVLSQVFEERLHLSPGAKELLEAAREVGAYTLLLSGGFTYFTERLKNDLQFQTACANVLEIKNGVLTGQVSEPILDAVGKKKRVQFQMSELGCNEDQVLVIGDGANDIPMMSLSTSSIAYHAKPATNNAAHHAIKFGALSGALDYFAFNSLPSANSPAPMAHKLPQ